MQTIWNLFPLRMCDLLRNHVTNLGNISDPCCIRAPKANHNVFEKVKAFDWSLELRISLHSYGLHRPTKNSTRLTARKPTMTQIHTFSFNGSMNEKTPGFCLSGFFIIILMPICINGFVKSTTLCLSFVIVKDASAMSVFWNNTRLFI